MRLKYEPASEPQLGFDSVEVLMLAGGMIGPKHLDDAALVSFREEGLCFLFSSLLLSSLELSDTKVYGPYIRALLASRRCYPRLFP